MINVILFLGFAFLWMHISIFCHEMGHAFWGKVVGLRPYWIRLGSGPALFKWNSFSIQFEWGLWPSGGLTYTQWERIGWAAPRAARFGLSVFILGGVLSNILLFIMAFQLYQHDPNAMVCWILSIEMLFILSSIIPLDGKLYGKRFPNDGKQLRSILLGRWREFYATTYEPYEAALRRYEPSATVRPLFNNDLRKLQMLVEAQTSLNAQAFPQAIALFNQLLQDNHLSRSERAYLLDLLTSIVTNYRQSEYLEQANYWSKEALELISDAKTLQGSRGAILIELGHYAEGKAILLSLVATSQDPTDIAFSSCYLAKADHHLGNTRDAQLWLQKADTVSQSIPEFTAFVASIRRELAGT